MLGGARRTSINAQNRLKTRTARRAAPSTPTRAQRLGAPPPHRHRAHRQRNMAHAHENQSSFALKLELAETEGARRAARTWGGAAPPPPLEFDPHHLGSGATSRGQLEVRAAAPPSRTKYTEHAHEKPVIHNSRSSGRGGRRDEDGRQWAIQGEKNAHHGAPPDAVASLTTRGAPPHHHRAHSARSAHTENAPFFALNSRSRARRGRAWWGEWKVS